MRQILLAVLFVLGCGGGSDPGPGGGPGPGPGSGSGGVTFRKVCHDIAQAGCDKAAECSPPGDSGCTAQIEQFCCSAQPNCDADSGGTQDQLDDCLAAFEDLTCDELENGDVPVACQ
jgi:hypothetical protein